MKNSFFVLIVLSILSVSCSKKQITKISAPAVVVTEIPSTPAPKTAEASNQPPQKEAEKTTRPVLVAKINRTPCFGKCPVFTIELFQNGDVVYNGFAHVARKGRFVAKVSPEFIKGIENKALSIKYLSFANKYPNSPIVLADLPVTITFIRIGDAQKQIINNFDAPRDLIEFEQWLEQVFDKLEWRAE
ncbi:MAG: hypothetical protein JNL70_14260 [Saprospiraceae bacterium]|nr:hypothetical protein [Saprospiraceae bacterium]